MRLAGATRGEIIQSLREIGTPERELTMRASQLWHWIYHRGAREFSGHAQHRPAAARSGSAKAARSPGLRSWPNRFPPTARASGSCAWRPLTRFDKGAEIECVYIPESDRGTLCVSSQVGCTLNCSFCHTGTMPLVRNLTAAEIVGQVLVARDRLGDFPGGSCSGRWARAQGRRRARGVQYRLHGHGRAALQLRGGA